MQAGITPRLPTIQFRPEARSQGQRRRRYEGGEYIDASETVLTRNHYSSLLLLQHLGQNTRIFSETTSSANSFKTSESCSSAISMALYAWTNPTARMNTVKSLKKLIISILFAVLPNVIVKWNSHIFKHVFIICKLEASKKVMSVLLYQPFEKTRLRTVHRLKKNDA